MIKVVAMHKLKELIHVLSDKHVIARENDAKSLRQCKICEGPAIDFRNTRSELEYNISMICQPCQDYYFPKKNI